MSDDKTFYVPMHEDEDVVEVNPKKKGKKSIVNLKGREVEWD